VNVVRAGVASALLAAAMLVTGGAQAAGSSLTLDVNFSATGTITLTLPDGTPVGTTSGPPTTISAGYYNVIELGPGGCASEPHFSLKGPGVSIFDNLLEGEEAEITTFEYLAPNSTYVWSSDAVPGVNHTFVTNSTIGGTPPPNDPSGLSSSSHTTSSSSSLIGSNVVPFRGTLTGAVSAAGKLTVEFEGKGVTTLKAGRYKISVTDKSSKSGFMLQRNTSGMITVTGAAFTGKHTATVHLTAGRWTLLTKAGTTASAISVS
jgi:hypothetical protein